MNIGIFCSANNDIAPQYFEATQQLGLRLGAEGHTLVFGGCNSGLMECVARAVKQAGGLTIGVIPSMVERGGRRSDHVDVAIHCDTLSDRKDLLLAKSDVMVALPGGIGTLDEVFTVAAAGTIGYHNKRVVLYDVDGFWRSLIACLDDLQARGMMRGDYHRRIDVAETLDELMEKIAICK